MSNRRSFADNATGFSDKDRRILDAIEADETSMTDIARSFGVHPNYPSKLRRRARGLDKGKSTR